MENMDLIKEEIWSNKILVLYQIVDESEIKEYLSQGASKSNEFFRILTKQQLKELSQSIKGNQAIIVIAIPDELHKYVYDIKEDFFEEYKSQFNYETNEDYLIDEISGSYTIWDPLSDNLLHFIPYSLIYGVISHNETNEPALYRNERYYDYLPKEEKKYICRVLKEATNQDIGYDEYLSLIRK